jgi:integrase
MVQLFFNTIYKNEENIRNYLKEKKFKELSIASYFTSLKRLYKLIDKDILIESILKDNNILFDLINECIDKIDAKTSKLTVMNGFINIFSVYNDLLHIKKKNYNFDALIEHFIEKFRQLSKGINYDRLYMEASNKEKENYITMEEVLELRNKYEKQCNEYVDFYPRIEQKYLILCLYTYLPPLRGQDYFNSKVYFSKDEIEDDQKNYVLLDEKRLYLNDYKTHSRYGDRYIDLPSKLIKVIKEYKLNSKSPWLLPKLSSYPKNIDEHVTSKNFTEILKKIFGKNVGSSMLRKIYVSEHIDNLNGNERKDLAKLMAHHPSSQMMTYTRFNEKIN